MERDSTGGPDAGWYIAEPDGTTWGPFTRTEFAAQRARGRYSGEALAWHVDFGEWRPLSRVAVTGPTRAGEASRERATAHLDAVAAQAQGRAKPGKAERKAMRAAAQAATASRASGAAVDDGRRLLQGAALARAAARPAPAPATKPVDLAKIGKDPAVAATSAARITLGMRRLLARVLDTLTLGMFAACVVYGIGLREGVGLGWPGTAALLWLAVFAIVPFAALSLALTGRTPAKLLLGLEVRTPAGGTPSFAQALAREADVALRGLGIGLPPLTLVAMLVAGAKLTNHGESSWDQRQRLTTRSAGDAKWQPALIATIAAIYLLATDVWQQLLTWIATR